MFQVMGNSAEACARQLTDAGADVVGANCGDPDPAPSPGCREILFDCSERFTHGEDHPE